MAPASEQEMKECFDMLDKNGVGQIKRSELGQALRSLGAVLTQKEVTECEREVAGDTLSWDKFKELAAKKPKQPEKSVAALRQAFQVFDQTSTGTMDMAELQHIVTSMGEKISAQEFEQIRKTIGLPASGPLEYRKLIDQVGNL
eukprot:TRINITY_DN57328_c0_g1_i1.p1 TRINITY_DN57328_c0_g1~~TRINITY_DN57328_c0_g1_i1.p1  ORF type:complete len:144 (-),score=27.69 TRINITY_DN57328_c0_g1_i1:100-531(-)